MDPPTVTFANLAKPEHEGFSVVIGFKHHLAAIATRHHVIDRAWILESNLTSHALFWMESAAKARKLRIRERPDPIEAEFR